MDKSRYKRAKTKKREYKLLTAAEAKELLDEYKVINHSFSWRMIDSKRQRLETSVWVPSLGIAMKLSGNIGRTNYSFTLTYKGYCLRTYNVHFRHHNPNCNDICGPHKHDWDEIYGTSWAYNANDVSTDNINSALIDFLKECNITWRGYEPFLL